MVLVHHGLFWRNEPLVVDRRLRGRLETLFHGDVSLLAYHLALDAHPELGNNAQLAMRLDAVPNGPFGTVGLDCSVSPQPIETLVRRVDGDHGAHATRLRLRACRDPAARDRVRGGGLRPHPRRARGLRRAAHRRGRGAERTRGRRARDPPDRRGSPRHRAFRRAGAGAAALRAVRAVVVVRRDSEPGVGLSPRCPRPRVGGIAAVVLQEYPRSTMNLLGRRAR